MANNDYFEYNLDSEEKKQTLSIGISGDYISLILENKSGNKEKYSSLVNLPQLIDVCKIFEELNSLKDALLLLNDTIEAGNIFLTPQENSFILKFIIKTETEEYPPFQIILSLDNNEETQKQEISQSQQGQYDVLPAKFDYQGNVEAEEKYGTSTKNTTEYGKPIIKSDYKQPIVQLQYIEPILQVHYPDGTTKSKPLPPRVELANGKMANLTEEEFRNIRELMDRNTNSQIRSNSVPRKGTSNYSLQTVPNPILNNIFNSLNYNDENNENIKEVEPSQYNINYSGYNNYDNMAMNKYKSQYSTRSVSNKPLYYNQPIMYSSSTYNKNNINNRSPPRNKTIEFAPRMINQNNQYIQQQNINYNKPLVSGQNNQFNIPNRSLYVNNQNYNNKTPFKSQALPNMPKINTNTQQIKNSTPVKDFKLFATVVPIKQIKRPNAASKSMIQQRPNIPNIQQIPQYQIPQTIPQIPQYQTPQQTIPQIPQYQIPQQSIQQIPQYENIQAMPQYQIPFQGQPAEPEEFDMKHQKERFQKQLKIQQEIVNAKTPVFPSVLPTKIWDTKFEFPQGRDYEEKIISQIKSQNQVVESYNDYSGYNQYETETPTYTTKYKNETETQKKMKFTEPKILPIIYSQDDRTGIDNTNINEQIVQQLQNYNQQNIENMEQNNEEGNLENNEIIEDNETKEANEQNIEQNEQQNQEQNGEAEDDIETLYKTEEGLIIFRNGILRGIIHRYSEIDEVISKIQDKLLKGAKFNLIYRAFTDGDKATNFHEKCDDHQMTLVLIETQEGVRFGGFTTKTWNGKNIKKIDNDAFVFSIETGKCYDVKNNEPAIGCYPKFGPVFFGCQIRIYDDFLTKGGTTCLKGLNYNTQKDYELNNGVRSYIVKEMEVYDIETIDI